MKSFKEFVELLSEAPMGGPPGGGLGSPGGLPPGGPPGGLGGPPPMGGGGMGGLGGPPMGGPSLGGLGGPGPGGQSPQQSQAFKIESPDVWKILKTLLGDDTKEEQKPEKQKPLQK